MQLKMYSIYDDKAGIFHPPFYQHNVPSAMRTVCSMISDSNSQLSKWPADFKLYELGEFSDSTGLVDGLDSPAFICAVIDLIQGPEDLKNREE